MQSDCQVKKARFQFLFFFRQRRQKILVRRDPRSEQGCDAEDEWIRAEGLDQASTILSWKTPVHALAGALPISSKAIHAASSRTVGTTERCLACEADGKQGIS
jgi:hypothetical protein